MLRFALCGVRSTRARFIAFLHRLIKDVGQKSIPIVDNLRAHQHRSVRNQIAMRTHEIELRGRAGLTHPLDPVPARAGLLR